VPRRLSNSPIQEDAVMNIDSVSRPVPVTHAKPSINVTPLIDVLLVI